MIHQVGERSFEPKSPTLRKVKRLGQSGGDGGGARTYQAANRAISDRAGWNRIEGVDVEHASRRRICNVAIADAIGPLERSAIGEVQIARIVARACCGREIGSRLPQTDRADRPTSEHRLGHDTHVTEKSPIAPDR